MNADTTVGAKVHTTKETKAPTAKATGILATKAMGAGPTTCLTLHRYSLSLRMLKAFTTYLCPAPWWYQCRWFAELKLLVLTNRVAAVYLMAKAL